MSAKLEEILGHARRTVPYYRKLFQKNDVKSLNDIPILKKEYILKSPTEFLSNQYEKDKLLRLYTSGTTGTPLEIFKSKEDIIRAGFSLWKIRSRIYGVSPDSLKAVFHIFTRDKGKIINKKMFFRDENTISLSLLALNDEDLNVYYRKLLDFKVEWIFGPASAIYLFSNFILKNNLQVPPSIKYIELAGEFVTQPIKDKIKECFGCPVIDNYGTAESYGISLECPAGRFHCLEDNVIVEAVKSQRNSNDTTDYGEILITTLNNFAMPLIRYSTGDLGVIDYDSKCKCGNTSPIINLNFGRTVDYAILNNGKRFNSSQFYYIVSKINQDLNDAILQFQVTQKHYSLFRVELVLKTTSKEHIKGKIQKMFLNEVNSLFGTDLIWDIQFTNVIKPSDNGKVKYFINEVSSLLSI